MTPGVYILKVAHENQVFDPERYVNDYLMMTDEECPVDPLMEQFEGYSLAQWMRDTNGGDGGEADENQVVFNAEESAAMQELPNEEFLMESKSEQVCVVNVGTATISTTSEQMSLLRNQQKTWLNVLSMLAAFCCRRKRSCSVSWTS